MEQELRPEVADGAQEEGDAEEDAADAVVRGDNGEVAAVRGLLRMRIRVRRAGGSSEM